VREAVGLRDYLAAAAALVRLGRPLFLTGGFVLYGLGAAVARFAAGSHIDAGLYLMGQAAVTSFQLMTHYANDYFDYQADVANRTPTRWSGGSRVLVSGALRPGVALAAALLLAGLGVLITFALARQPGTAAWVAPLLLLTGALSWAYSAPPLRLHSTGLGELDTAVIVTGLVPLLGFYLQAPGLVGLPVLLLALVPLALLQVAMLLAIEFPDAEGDRAVGKNTLVVRLGAEAGARLYLAVVAIAYLSLPALVAAGLPAPVALAAGIPGPLAAWRLVRVGGGDFRRPARWEGLAFWAVALLVITSVAELIAFVWIAQR
jgi:1,4-dihydroxy-2-naphthoate polyprenyltransferase